MNLKRLSKYYKFESGSRYKLIPFERGKMKQASWSDGFLNCCSDYTTIFNEMETTGSN